MLIRKRQSQREAEGEKAPFEKEEADFEESRGFSIQHTQYLKELAQEDQDEAENIDEEQPHIYLPHQDQKEVVRVRKGYSALLERLQREKCDLAATESERLSELLNEANSVFRMVHSTCDAALDARFIAGSADLGAEKVHRLPVSVQSFTLSRYLSIVRDFVRSQQDAPWSALGQLTGRFWRGVSTPDYMLGPIGLKPKKRVVRQAKVAGSEDIGPAKAPTKLDVPSAADVPAETSQFVVMVHGVLSQSGPIPLYRLVVDPGSFAQTVENLFYVSFLVNDNLARLEYDETEDQLVVEAVAPSNADEPQTEEAPLLRTPQQMILGMTERLWKQSIQRYSITAPLIRYS